MERRCFGVNLTDLSESDKLRRTDLRFVPSHRNFLHYGTEPCYNEDVPLSGHQTAACLR